jgi:hypothetical protein
MVYFWLENLNGRDHLEDLNTDERMALKWILGKQGGKVWPGCICLRIWTRNWFFEHVMNLQVP